MKDKVILVTNLISSNLDSSVEVDAADDEMHLTYYHFGPEGQKMETTLIVTDILEEELDR